jgi:hypothetical protein
MFVIEWRGMNKDDACAEEQQQKQTERVWFHFG